MALLDQIIAAESGGNPYAVNPKSSAAGVGQFIDSTWLDMIKKYRPDIAAGRSNAQILQLKFNPGLSREMTSAYAKENSDYLRSRGFEPTDQNVYLAHFAGPQGAVALLSNPDAPASSLLKRKAVEANPFLSRMTGRQVIDWAGGKITGKPVKYTGKPVKYTGKPVKYTENSNMNLYSLFGIPENKSNQTGTSLDYSSYGSGYGNLGNVLNSLLGGNVAEAYKSKLGSVSANGVNANNSNADFSTLGGTLNTLFGKSPGESGKSNLDNFRIGASSDTREVDPLAQTAAMNNQALSSVMNPSNPNVDMARLIQILQQRSLT